MRDQVFAAMVNAINTCQTASGHVGTVTGNTCPMRDLNGFDSLVAVEVSIYVSASLGRDSLGDIGLFVTSAGEHRTVDEIVDSICQTIQKQESA